MIQYREAEGRVWLDLDLSNFSVIRRFFAFLLIFLTDWHTFCSVTWRFAVCIADVRTFWRWIADRPLADVVCITNMRDETDRARFIGKFHPACGHFNGPRYWLRSKIACRTRSLDVTAEELLHPSTRREAKQKFLDAVRWAQRKGARVILLAAGTKRLFGRDGAELKALFPDMIFTIGDNGTSWLLLQEVLAAFRKAGLSHASRIGVLGAGILGTQIVESLQSLGFTNLVGLTNNGSFERFGIQVCQVFEQMGKLDLVVSCTHSPEAHLTAERVELLRQPEKKLLVIDVSEPSNLSEQEYEKCESIVIRQDAGNAFAPTLKYVLGCISYRMFRLSRGVAFGCFAEAMALFSALQRGEPVKTPDWFAINSENMSLVETFFCHDGFKVPSPRCFGEPVKSFELLVRRE
jgi:predicted amino acid dehydrogenase